MAKIRVNVKRLNEYIDKSGYRRAFIAERVGMIPPRFSEKTSGRVSLYPEELINILRVIGFDDTRLKNESLVDWYEISAQSSSNGGGTVR